MVHDDTPDAVLPVAVDACATTSSAHDGYPATVRIHAPDADEPLAPAPYVRLRWRYRRPAPCVRVVLPTGSDDRVGVVLEFDTPQFAATVAAQLAAIAEQAASIPAPDPIDDGRPF